MRVVSKGEGRLVLVVGGDVVGWWPGWWWWVGVGD